MTRIEQTITIDAPPDEVWRVAGDPGAIADWVPALAGATYDGNERTCTTGEGGTIRERIVEHSDDERFYVYEVMEAPLPVSGYRSTFAVEGHGGHSHVVWSADFEVRDGAAEEDVAAALEQLYQQGLAGLRDQVEAG
jgi:uncharacterized protein YndB with AHSA1/START domain